MVRSRSDRRASRRVGLAAALLHLGYGIVWVAFLTGVPVALVDLIEGELRPTLAGPPEAPRRSHRRLVSTAVLLLVLTFIGACVFATAGRTVLMSVAAGSAAMIAVAYRRRRGRAGNRFRLPSAEQPSNPHGAGHD